jgi:hypothetical protein
MNQKFTNTLSKEFVNHKSKKELSNGFLFLYFYFTKSIFLKAYNLFLFPFCTLICFWIFNSLFIILLNGERIYSLNFDQELKSFLCSIFMIVFLAIYLPLQLSLLSFRFFVQDWISKIFFWFLGAISVLSCLWAYTYLNELSESWKYSIFILNPIFLFVIYVYAFNKMKT